MKAFKKFSFSLVPLLLFSSLPALCGTYIAVDKTSATNGASISSSLSSQTRSTQKNAFLSDEPVNLTFHLTIAEEDIGTQSELFLLTVHNGYAFMRNQAGQWLPWNGQASTLQATASKKLQAQENLTVLNKISLPGGEYILFSAYRTSKGDLKHNRNPVTFIVNDNANSALHRVQSAAFLTEYLSHAQTGSGYGSQLETMDGAAFSGTTSANNTSQPANVSQTNLQEAGVDESDTIKVTGDILFALEQCNTNTELSSDTKVDQPATGIAISEDSFFAPYPEQNNSCLSSYRIQEAPASATRLDQEILKSTGYEKGTLLLNSSSNSTPPNRLVWLSSNMAYDIWTSWGISSYWTNNSTTLKFFDISDPKNLTAIKTLSLDGALITSRRIGDQLYLITRKNHFPINPLAGTPESNNSSLPLPNIVIDDGAKQSLVKATDCFVPASRSDQPYDGTIVTITSLSISNPDDFHSTCIAGNIETAYVSTKALYLATTRYPYFAVNNVISYNQAPEYSTEIHKFAFTDNHVSYKSSGTVPGHLGWEMDKKPFRMGEHNDILKVATSLGESWNMNSKTRVAVLQENSSGNVLEEISFLDNLGKPGERLYAARFIGNRGYLVTFRVTDPLYMLDFTEPEAPKILGELEIEGYSDYLHPIGENYLLGIGKDAIADSSATDFAGRGAWYQGVKLSLFDVSDGANMKEVQSVIIGKRGSSSAVLSDHHALAWLATDDPDNFRLAIPINEHSTQNALFVDSQQPWAYYNWTRTGAYVFDVQAGNTPNLSLSGRLITESLDNGDQQTYSYNDRVILQGSSLHFIHDNRVYSSAINDLD